MFRRCYSYHDPGKQNEPALALQDAEYERDLSDSDPLYPLLPEEAKVSTFESPIVGGSAYQLGQDENRVVIVVARSRRSKVSIAFNVF